VPVSYGGEDVDEDGVMLPFTLLRYCTNPLLCNRTVTLLWKCNKLIVTQQELLRYYGNAIWCIDHATEENLICKSSKDIHYCRLECLGHVGLFGAADKKQVFDQPCERESNSSSTDGWHGRYLV
jgi:hypothetical protein